MRGMAKRRGGKVAVFAGAIVAITLTAAGSCWKGFLESLHFDRIRQDPAYFLTIIERPEGTAERRAIRRWFRSPEGALAVAEERRSPVRPEQRDWPIESLEPGITVRAEAETPEALLSLLRPTLPLNRTEMVW